MYFVQRDRKALPTMAQQEANRGSDIEGGIKPSALHAESASLPGTDHDWKYSKKSHDGDTALALFADADAAHEQFSAEEEDRLVRKIDFMILPYLAVCYAFFYIDKTTLSYAAIFGIRDDLHLHGTQYNWLSSLFYFGFLAWAFPTNFMMQKFPIGKQLKRLLAQC